MYRDCSYNSTTYPRSVLITTASFWNNGNIDGKSTTTVDSEIGAYVRSFANSDAGTSATAAVNRLAWL